jgi:hypothetical protein
VRHALALVAGVGLVIAPLVVLGGEDASTAVSAAPAAAPAGHTRSLTGIALAGNRIAVATTTTAAPTTTTVPPPPPTTTTAAAPAPVTTTTMAPRVFVPPPTTTTTAPPAASNVVSGIATWFGTGTGAGYCASQVAPRGAIIRITVNGTISSITCLVNDYEAAGPPFVVDLAPADFAQLAPTSQGQISVTISW